YLLGETLPPQALGVWLGLWLSMLVGLWLARHRFTWQSRLLAIWLLVPPAVLAIISLQAEYFRPRYVITAQYALLIAVIVAGVHWGEWVTRRKQWGVFGAASITLVLVVLGGRENYAYFYTDPPKAPDWRTRTAYLAARTLPNDV